MASIACGAANVLSGAHDSRLPLNLEVIVAQTPARNATDPLRRPQRDTPPPIPDAPVRVVPPAAAHMVDVDGLLRLGARRARVCVLCGRPLRAGQRLLRVHGTTVHARCSNTG